MVSGTRPRARSRPETRHAWRQKHPVAPSQCAPSRSVNPHGRPRRRRNHRPTAGVFVTRWARRGRVLHPASHATDGRRGQRHIRLSTAQAVTDRRRVFAAPHRHEPTNQSRTSATAPTAGGGQHHRRANIPGIERHTEDTRIGLVIIHADPSSRTHHATSKGARPSRESTDTSK